MNLMFKPYSGIADGNLFDVWFNVLYKDAYSIYIGVYIHIYKENLYVHTSFTHIYLYVYIYIYICTYT